MADSSAQGLSVNPSGDSFVLTIRINEITINGTLPFTVVDGFANRAPGLDVNLVYDLVATDADGMKHRLHEGEFVIKPGVTRSS